MRSRKYFGEPVTVKFSLDEFKKLLPRGKHSDEEAQAIFYYYLAVEKPPTLEDLASWSFLPTFEEFYDRFREHLPFEDWCYLKGINPMEKTKEIEEMFQEDFYDAVMNFAEYTESGGWVYLNRIPPSAFRKEVVTRNSMQYPEYTIRCRSKYLYFGGIFAEPTMVALPDSEPYQFTYICVNENANIPQSYINSERFFSKLTISDSGGLVTSFSGDVINVFYFEDHFVIQIVNNF